MNADFLINQLTKYFYTTHLTPLLHLKNKFAPSMAEFFRNIHFLPHFQFLKVSETCNISNKSRPPNK